MSFKLIIIIEVDGMSGFNLGSGAEGRGPLPNPGEDILAFLGLFAGLGHYYTLLLVDVLEEGGFARTALLVYIAREASKFPRYGRKPRPTRPRTGPMPFRLRERKMNSVRLYSNGTAVISREYGFVGVEPL